MIGRGEGAIAGIAEIAGIARHRKGKTLPRIDTDDADQETIPWDDSHKPFGILVEGRGEGGTAV
jgi:hypothetical protein